MDNKVPYMGRSAQIYTVRQCVTSTFHIFYKASFSENYFMVLKIYANPYTLVCGVTSQVLAPIIILQILVVSRTDAGHGYCHISDYLY